MNARLAAVALAALLAACASAPPAVRDAIPTQPEGASGHLAKPGWSARTFAVAAANPLAAEAGVRMLRAGGSAVDAAIAVQMVLTLVEPQSSGIGGGAFLLHYDGRVVEAYDGRETAPAAADENLFVGADGKPMPFLDAVVGGRAVGVPGALRMLEMAHRQHGRLAVVRALPTGDRAGRRRLRGQPAAARAARRRAVAAPRPGRRRLLLRRRTASRGRADTGSGTPNSRQVLRAIAARGSAALHEGPVAEAIVAKVRDHPTNPGRLSLADLAGYQPKPARRRCASTIRRARAARSSCAAFRRPARAPSRSAQILGMLKRDCRHARSRPLGRAPGAEWLHVYTEAARLAFADRGQYVADPDFVAPPAGSWASLLDARLPRRARSADRPAGDASGAARPPRRRQDRPRADARPARGRHQPHQHRRRPGPCAGDDHDDRGRVRRAADGPRLPAQQRADRLQLRARATPPARRSPTGSSRASARARRWRRRWCSTRPPASSC